jgi:hypothetical protein
MPDRRVSPPASVRALPNGGGDLSGPEGPPASGARATCPILV